MSDIFQIAAVGLAEGRQRLEAISLNAASASVPGYRRHVALARPFDAVLEGANPSALSGSLTAAATLASEITQPRPQYVDLRPGAKLTTGRQLDVAIDNPDLFFALTDGTKTWLTRGGSFQVNEQGVLVGELGLRLIGAHGDVRLPGSDVEIAPDGSITHQGVVVATLQLFKPNDPSSLLAAQGSLLEAPAGVHPAEPGAGRLTSGMLEGSNTDPASEMLGLMSLSRQFEALSHIVQGYDELQRRAIQKMAEV